MPIHFDDPGVADHSNSVAWLRFVEEDDGRGIRAALFQTSTLGEPLEFCFTRMDVSPPPLAESGADFRNSLTALAKSLFRAASRSPDMILGLADEIPARTFTDNLRVKSPFCLVRSADTLTSATSVNGHLQQLIWLGRQSHEMTRTRRVLDEAIERDDPFEPFERAARGLAEAFADRRVRDMASISGLNVLASLYPLPGLPERPDIHAPETGEGVRDTGLVEKPALALAERLWAVLAAPRKFSHADWSSRLKWPGELMPFQQDGVRALLDMDRLLLADDMGLGKTIQAIAAMRILRARQEIESCLVVAPAGVLDQWRREIAKWAPELTAIIIRGPTADRSWQWATKRDVTLVSYDTLRSDFGDSTQSPVRGRTWDMVVADEAQRIKNRNPTSNALKGLRRVRSWALTGTPLENNEEELASIIEFIDNDGTHPPKRYRPGVELLNRHRELQLRRKKGEVLEDLPPKLVTKLAVELPPGQRASYRKAEEEGIIYLKSLGAEVGITHVLELITRLKQICNADPKTGESVKLDNIKNRLKQLTAQGHKALIFSQYTNDVSGVAAAVNRLREFNPLSLTGDMPQPHRADVIERFKRDDHHKVLALSLRAGGLGLNLQEASYVFHLDRWWNPAVERQAEDRSHRMGQTVKVNVIKYSCVGTIEERIDKILERKQGLFDHLIDDVSLNLSAQMSREELLGLFGLA